MPPHHVDGSSQNCLIGTGIHTQLELGRRARTRGDHAAALQHFAAAAATAPSNPWPRIEQAATLRSLGRHAEAEALYAAVLADHPGQLQALLGLGLCARARGDHAAALQHFAAAAATAPSNPWPRIEQAATLRSLGRHAEAEALYAAVLADHPGQLQALLGLGLCARARGARNMAAAHFRRATEANPWASAAWAELATELCDAGDYDAARDAANKLLAHDPGNLQAWMILGRTERSASRRPEALAAFRRAQECNPRDPLPLIEMATEMRATGQPWEARRLLEQALEIDGQNLHALTQLGELARLTCDYDAALALFSRARSLTPSSPWAYLGAAQTLSDLGRCDKALMLLDEAERNCGSSLDLISKRIDLLQQVGEWHRACSLAREASAAAPYHFGLWTQRFRMELKLSTPEEVEACLGAAPAASVGDLGSGLTN